MIEVQILNLVFRGMDLIIRVFEIGLDNEGGRVTCLQGRGMIATGVSAFSENVGNITILCQPISELIRSKTLGKSQHTVVMTFLIKSVRAGST